MSEELKPCPFCGDIPDDSEDDSVACLNQNCPMDDLSVDAAAWNRRSDAALLAAQERVKVLEVAVNETCGFLTTMGLTASGDRRWVVGYTEPIRKRLESALAARAEGK